MNKEKIREIIQKQREFFSTNTTKNIHFRLSKLEKLKRAVENNEVHILEGLKQDLNKSEFEAYLTEIGIVKNEIKLHIKNLKKWSKREKACSSLSQLGTNSYIYKEPLGTVLIISPWNYPFNLSILPLIGAISAGNTAILKVSEFSNHTSKVLEKIISETFEEKYIKVVQGDAEVGEKLLDEKFDLIFFTGSTNVGRIVMAKAAKYLCPVVLELGGQKSSISR